MPLSSSLHKAPLIVVILSSILFYFLFSKDVSTSSLDSRLPVHQSFDLSRRDDSQCSATKPCVNGACCGKSGYCGYGDAYCGAGCQSNCNATAECGQYASPAGKTCPLNTCCSSFGFCGTTADFCGTGCQSNCVANPAPSGAKGGALDRVIGYYEAWSARSSCHPVKVTDLPLDTLTHINFAFGSIDPTSFNIVPMDASTPDSLFSDVTAAKQNRPNLKVFISLGGWSFSDNGTTTQPIFGNIASSAANRKQFANNAVSFMNRYGFDGIDIDWEYPGAPDRGGKTEDTNNFVLLLQDMRSTFQASSRPFGLTFTAPASYWYLRWFDIPGMLKYADWVNVMTYDLHGTWDSNNPIGSIVQGHTNLTEIKIAMELFWRVQVPPAKISMGFGFYGRSFQLADASCTTPGCPFLGGASPGPCTGTSGILAYYEIQALLKQSSSPAKRAVPVHDQDAAVKYLVYNKDQWVSYDDAETFKQKTDWANSIGLGGSLIWASDQDDDQYTAHAGLTGKAVGSDDLLHPSLKTPSFGATKQAANQNMAGQSGQNCAIRKFCTLKSQPTSALAKACPDGQKIVGWETGVLCKSGQAYPICCNIATAPTSCRWRGVAPQCIADNCYAGETALFNSRYGDSENQYCIRGSKSFCCDAPDYLQAIESCRWTGCTKLSDLKCNADEVRLAAHGLNGACQQQGGFGANIAAQELYCCKRPARLEQCVWRGTAPSCDDSECKVGEVTIYRDEQGDADNTGGKGVCKYGGKKNLCCAIDAPPPTKLTCPNSACDEDDPNNDDDEDFCDFGDGAEDEYSPSDDDTSFKKRNATLSALDVRDELEKRGSKRPFTSKYVYPGLGLISILWELRGYASRGQLWRSQQRLEQIPHVIIEIGGTDCASGSTVATPVDPNNPPRNGETEHPLDGQMMAALGATLLSGRLPGGGRVTGASDLTLSYVRRNFQTETITGLPLIGSNTNALRTALTGKQRVEESFGSNTNSAPFLLVDRQINAAKGKLFGLEAPRDLAKLRKEAQRAADSPSTANLNRLFSRLRATIGVFSYGRQPLGLERMQLVRDTITQQFALLDIHRGDQANTLTSIWEQFFPAYLRQIEDYAQAWMQDALNTIEREFANAGSNDPIYLNARYTIQQIRSLIRTLVFDPSLGPSPPPKPPRSS